MCFTTGSKSMRTTTAARSNLPYVPTPRGVDYVAFGNATEIPTGGGPRLMLITMTTHLQHTTESDGLASACTSHQPS